MVGRAKETTFCLRIFGYHANSLKTEGRQIVSLADVVAVVQLDRSVE